MREKVIKKQKYWIFFGDDCCYLVYMNVRPVRKIVLLRSSNSETIDISWGLSNVWGLKQAQIFNTVLKNSNKCLVTGKLQWTLVLNLWQRSSEQHLGWWDARVCRYYLSSIHFHTRWTQSCCFRYSGLQKDKNVIICNYIHLAIPWNHRRLRPNATECGWSQLSLGKDGGEDKRLSALFGLQVRATCWGRCH